MLIKIEQFLKPHSKKAIFFLCPYATPITKLRLPVRSLQRDGYSVIAIGYERDIFSSGEPDKLFTAIEQTKDNIRNAIKELSEKSYTEFGFVGSSLGGFAIYNCINDIPELAWGVVIAGGDITKAIWSFDTERQKFEANGFTRQTLAKRWHELQYPKLGNLESKRYLMVASKRDRTAGYTEAIECIEQFRAAGAQAKLVTHRNLNHRQTVIRNLARIRKLVSKIN